MKQPIFITGIGTGVGKTVAAAVIAEALGADYWKPIQAGFDEGTDALTVSSLSSVQIHKELYKLQMPASPHLAAKAEHITLKASDIAEAYSAIETNNPVIVEGAGGLLVPINEKETIADIIKALNAKVILVSRNYLGSINHSLLTAHYCKTNGINVAGWFFNDQFMNYENDIVEMSGLPSLGNLPNGNINKEFVQTHAKRLRTSLQSIL